MTRPERTNLQSKETVLDCVQALRVQEERSYLIPTCHLERWLIADSEREESEPKTKTPSLRCKEEFSDYLTWRKQMAEWCFSVADLCKIRTETVEIAMNILDRFVSYQIDVMTDPELFQLACTTAFYIAVKIHDITSI